MKPLSKPLVDAVKQIPTPDVVAALRLEPSSEERNKFRCPKHGGTSLHVYPDRAMCYGGCRTMDNIDLVREVFGLDFRSAVKWLEEHFLQSVTQARVMSNRAVPLKPGIDLDLQQEVIGTLTGILELTPKGGRYLASRGLDPACMRDQWDITSIDREDWERVRKFLRSAFTHAELMQCGMQAFGRFGGAPVDVVVLPWFSANHELSTIRLRRTSGASGPKYLSMKRCSTPRDPFGAEYVYCQAPGRVVHVTEGELDALTLASEWTSPDYAKLRIIGAMLSSGLCGVGGTATRQVASD
ncbi:hypothetical protein ACFL3B_02510 [Gemmatimonadota bacterium]